MIELEEHLHRSPLYVGWKIVGWSHVIHISKSRYLIVVMAETGNSVRCSVYEEDKDGVHHRTRETGIPIEEAPDRIMSAFTQYVIREVHST